MKKICFFIAIFLFTGITLVGQTVTATGGNKPLYVEEGIKSTGLDKIFLFYGMTDAQLTYTSPTPDAAITWYRYQYHPDDAVKLSGIQTDDISFVLTDVQPNYGYIIINEGVDYSDTIAVWVADYTQYISDFRRLNVVEKNDKCTDVYLQLEADIPDIAYYTFSDGRLEKLIRTYEIEYETLKWNELNREYDIDKQKYSTMDVDAPIRVNAPLTDTHFTLREKKYAEVFDDNHFITSDTYTAVRVDAHAFAEVVPRKGPGNEITPPDTIFRFSASAPIDVNFFGYVSDAVRHFSWEFSNREDFSVLTATYPEQDLSFTFDRTGTYYIRLNVSDLFNNCSTFSNVFEITVYESFIEAPNYFTPGSSSGKNEEFKVSYKSIRKFKCSIYNRHGSLIYEYSDPSLGWDGKMNGRLVPPGVYFYVIEAEGSDGIKHKLKGDINLLYSKNNNNNNQNE